ncbi:SGNH/GDSL hydrolase family protein [Alteromonas flava]|uniref:SGNH/GDSL hydrolase family protein n=1 Tax=Alteromonas flava TaxID=2048003 RepID=UPI000C28BC6B|nr:SGNH/GDSL hydrolase family protein [Alteromonas flava]
MLHYLRIGLLAPLLFYQGKQVRKITPVLPEPHGARKWGSREAKFPILLIGDSSAAGVGASTQADALLGQLARRLKPYDVSITLVARTGATSADALHWLQDVSTKYFAAVITVFGVNHVVANHTQQRWLREQSALFTELQRLFDEPEVFSCGLPPMHCFPALPQPLRWCLGARAIAFDTALKRLTGAHSKHHYCAIKVNQTPDMMAHDGFHPSTQGYQTWSQQLATQLLKVLHLKTIE